jgi:hypothetical protein
VRVAIGVFTIAYALGQWSGVTFAQTDTASPLTGKPVTFPSPEILGTWDAIQRSHGGIGSTVILSADSSFVLVLGAMVDMRYRVDGDDFFFLNDDSTNSPVEKQRLTFSGGQAVLSALGCSRKLTRLDSLPRDSGIVGRWKSLHRTGVPAYEEYTVDGRTRMRVPIQVQRGSFLALGNSIAFHTVSPAPENWYADFQLRGDTLAFSIDAQPHQYLRARPLIPADVQQPREARPSRC